MLKTLQIQDELIKMATFQSRIMAGRHFICHFFDVRPCIDETLFDLIEARLLDKRVGINLFP